MTQPTTPIADQPPPTPNDQPAIIDLVIADLTDRKTLGIQRYGTPLQAHNGRDALIDAYQEALDLAAYLRQAIEERGVRPTEGDPVTLRARSCPTCHSIGERRVIDYDADDAPVHCQDLWHIEVREPERGAQDCGHDTDPMTTPRRP